MRRHAALLTIGTLFAATPSWACSMAPGYRVPTNLELAAKGETIVVAEVIGERKTDDPDEPWNGMVLARPITLLRGERMPVLVELPGFLSDDPRRVIASAPRELRRPNPGALIGGCVRYIFIKRSKLVLFLARSEKGALEPYRSSFSRDAEDVSGDDALWVKAVREYAAISSRPRAEWRAALTRRRDALRGKPDDPDAAAIADDMAVELSAKRLPPTD